MNPNTPDAVKPAIARQLVPGANEGTSRRLAQDQATPGDVLRQLAAHPSPSVRGAVAANQAATTEVLRLLASDSEPGIRARAGGSLQLPLDSLVTLATDADPAVRVAVAGNASAPPEILMRLAADGEPQVVMGVVKNTSATSGVLQTVVDRHGGTRHELDSVARIVLGGDLLVEVARNSKTPPGALHILADSRNAIRVAVAGNPSTGPNVLDELARTVHEHVWLTGSPDRNRLDPENERDRILSAIVRNPSSALATLQFLSSGDWVARRTTTRSEREDGHTTTWTIWDPRATEGAQKEKASWVRSEISRRQWSGDTDLPTRLRFATNNDASPAILAELARDTDDSVRTAVAANRSTPHSPFMDLAGDPVPTVRIAAATASHPPADTNKFAREDLYRDAFERLAVDEVADVRAALVENSAIFWRVLSAPVREKLVFDPEIPVREALARSYVRRDRLGFGDALSARAYGQLVDLGDVEVWRQVAYDFRAPSEVLERLVDVGDEEAAVAAVGRIDTGSEALVRLAGSSVPTVVSAVLARRDLMNAPAVTRVLAANVGTSPSDLERLVRYATDDETLVSAVGNPNFPEATLLQFATGSDDRLLRAVVRSRRSDVTRMLAANPLAPVDVLASLADVDDAQVREALLVNKATPAEVLLRLVQPGEARQP